MWREQAQVDNAIRTRFRHTMVITFYVMVALSRAVKSHSHSSSTMVYATTQQQIAAVGNGHRQRRQA